VNRFSILIGKYTKYPVASLPNIGIFVKKTARERRSF